MDNQRHADYVGVDLAAIRLRHTAATPQPWRTDIADLLGEVERLRAALQEVRDDIHEQWSMRYARSMDRRFGTVPLDQDAHYGSCGDDS